MSRALLFRLGALALGAAGAALLAAAADRLVVARLAPPFRPLLPPGSRIRYTTSEYACVARINRLGFRDREFDFRRKKEGVRVLALGDSFTFGWGVAAQESWPKVLEADARRAGAAVEVVNAGAAGAGTEGYAEIAEGFIPAVKPDLVLVAVLQGDDYAQTFPPVPGPPAPPARPSLTRRLGQQVFAGLCPNLRRWRHHRPGPPQDFEARDDWRAFAAERVTRLTPQEKAKFDGLDPRVRAMFRSGDLNASLVTLAMVEPDHYSMTFRLEERRLARMAGHLARVRAEADRHRARVLVCSVPYPAYVSRRGLEATRAVGFEVRDDFLTSAAPDEAIRRACRQAGVPFLTVHGEFRAAGAGGDLYFEYDGHFNAAGQRVFAGLLGARVRAALASGHAGSPRNSPR